MTKIELQKIINEKICLQESIYDKGINGLLDYDYIEVCDKLEEEINYLMNELLFVDPPVASNETLSLYLNHDKSCDDELYYIVSQTGSHQVIGEISVLAIADKYYGNVGYSLNKEHRGNGYMLQALNLLTEPLIDFGVDKPIFTVKTDNIASVKTIQGYGGILIDSNEDIDTYEVDLNTKTR